MPDNIQFNHEIILDLTWIEPRPHKPVLHIVDRGTHLSAAEFLVGESSEDIWNTFISCWVTVYVGFPDILSHDFGSAFSSGFFQKTCAEFGIITKEIPCESHDSLGPGEHYHAPLKSKAFNRSACSEQYSQSGMTNTNTTCIWNCSENTSRNCFAFGSQSERKISSYGDRSKAHVNYCRKAKVESSFQDAN